MKFAVAGTIALLFTSGAAFSQSTQAAQTTTTVITMSRNMSTCPIGMQARHAFFTQRQLANDQHSPDGKRTSNAAMELRLTLTPQDKRHIEKAWVTIVGLSGKDAKFMPARDSNGKEGTLQKSMQIAFAPGDDGNADAYFRALGFGSVHSIQLKSVTYSDGSTWKLPAQDACSVAPDGLMLVAAD
ncbi:MAG TPA: hypothetical protein VG844_12165 [Terracidiphilus sp.]|nr:hypothetical protein [Terracidiphilus sp.]